MTSQHSILVADDDPSVRRLLVRVAQFVAPHMEVVEAQTGAEALTALQQHAFTVIITDYHMPGNTGLEIVLAAHAQSPTRPIIVVSAQHDVEAIVLAAGATLFIAKPFAVEHVAATLRSLLASA
ncbi:MAG: response regulator [Chloroflexota bacterium]|nr:response regulator [Chloroflexota bacterium]